MSGVVAHEFRLRRELFFVPGVPIHAGLNLPALG